MGLSFNPTDLFRLLIDGRKVPARARVGLPRSAGCEPTLGNQHGRLVLKAPARRNGRAAQNVARDLVPRLFLWRSIRT